MYDEEARNADIVITTALIPGRPAPRLITAETVAGMANGSVIVDMAAANGGNCELTRADEKVVTDNLVTHPRLHRPGRPAGRPDLPALRHQHRQPVQAADPREGRPAHPGPGRRRPAGHDRRPCDGETHVAAAAGPGLGRARSRRPRRAEDPAVVAARKPPRPRPGPATPRTLSAIAAALVVAAVTYSPPSFLGYFTVFALAVVVGFYVISGVVALAAHAADVRDQRDLRDHPGRRPAAARLDGPGRSRSWRSSPPRSPRSTSSVASW